MNIRAAARALGGDVRGDQILCPGPGHSPKDRSLSVKFDPDAPDGLLVHCFGAGDPLAAKDHVRQRLGLDKHQLHPNGRNEPAKFDYRDPATGEVLYSKLRLERRGSRDKKIWFKPEKRGGSEPLLYGGEKLAKHPKDKAVFVVEGENKVDGLAQFGAVAVSADTGAKSNWLPRHAEMLRGRTIILWPDSDDEGETYVRNAAAALRADNPDADIRVVRPFGPPNGSKGKDVCDWSGDKTALAELVRAAQPYEDAPRAEQQPSEGRIDDDAEIKRLVGLREIDYERQRKDAAETLGIARLSILDKLVEAERAKAAPSKTAELCADTEPSDESVNVADLLEEIYATIGRFVVCGADMKMAATLWIAFTWIIDHATVAPLLIITAPEKECGKSQKLDLVGRLSRRSLCASNISPSATFRVIEANKPTLIIDEADAFFKENEELRGLINSGHTRTTAFVIRNVEVNGDHEPRQFSTWGAKAIAGIGKLPETVMSRGIIISLRRKTKEEKVERLRHAQPSLFEGIARKLARFGQDHAAAIGRARPDIPEELSDRAQDNWEHLIAIADLAGGRWPKAARKAALDIQGSKSDSPSTGEQLLESIRTAFEEAKADKLARDDLMARLHYDEEEPWATWNRGKPLTANQLRRMLEPYDIHTKKVRVAEGPKQGFERSQFKDAWTRYLDKIAGPAADEGEKVEL